MASIVKFSMAVCLIGVSLVNIDACTDSSDFYMGKAQNYITVLGENNFQRFLDENENVFVLFNKNESAESIFVGPEFAKMAQKLHDMDSTIKLGKVDGNTEWKLAERNNVWYYPTLKLFTGERRKPSRVTDNVSFWNGLRYDRRWPCTENIMGWARERTKK